MSSHTLIRWKTPQTLKALFKSRDFNCAFQQLAKISSSSSTLNQASPQVQPEDEEQTDVSVKDHISIVDKALQHDDYFNVKSLVQLDELFKARVHLGHNEGLRDPSMTPYIFGCRQGTDIIDIEQTVPLLQDALDVMAHVTYRGGMILFLSRHLQTLPWVERMAKETGEFSHCRPWRRGIFTNSSKVFGTLPILPELCVFLHTQDSVFEPHRAIVESSKLLVPSIGVCDTNSDNTHLTYHIPGNDDTPDAVNLYLRLFKEAIMRGKARRRVDGLDAEQ